MAPIAASATLLDLPNELILHTLQPFTTRELLPLALVSYRFYGLIVRLLQSRLLLAANLPEHTLLLECYHPSQRLTEPALYTTYLGTPGLDTHLKNSDDVTATPVGRLAELRDLYSSFQPHRKLAKPRTPRRHPAGDIPGSRTHTIATMAARKAQNSEEPEAVKQIVSLEGHELFTQLCAQVNLVRTGGRREYFSSFVEVEEGVVRVFRDWLRNGAEDGLMRDHSPEWQYDGKGKQKRSTVAAIQCDKRIKWIRDDKNVGIRTKVTERRWRRDMPILFHSDDEIAVSYDVEYQGKNSN
jgi:hypothetical protein